MTKITILSPTTIVMYLIGYLPIKYSIIEKINAVVEKFR
jgi:hypothetical protein